MGGLPAAETARRAGGRGGGYALAAPLAERLTAEVASSPLQTGASMANDEHVALLKQGVAAWNAWRAENRNIRPNLSGAHLSEENLRGADLSTAILRGAVLRAAKLGKANLRLANLSETDLRWANLSKAKLGKATLSKANLSLTNLSGANLCQANLGGVNLERANLRGADLSGANLWSATLVGTDLTVAARALGKDIVIVHAGSDEELEPAFAALSQAKVGALLIAPDGLFIFRAAQVAALSVRHAIPASHERRAFPDAGGLMSYGSSQTDGMRLAGAVGGRILKGAKPVDLPVLQATKFEFVINLKTAKALGLDVSADASRRADEVIE